MIITVDLYATHGRDAPLISHQKLIKLAGDLHIQFMSIEDVFAFIFSKKNNSIYYKRNFAKIYKHIV